MRIAITSTSNHSEALIDPRFGRCAYFAIYDTDTSELVFLPNPAKDADSAAGPAAVRFAVGQKVNKIISGHFGNKVTPLLEKLGIETQIEENEQKTIQTIINQLKI
jgi:predicted Fe-Mo cluster-binding NifX family protein